MSLLQEAYERRANRKLDATEVAQLEHVMDVFGHPFGYFGENDPTRYAEYRSVAAMARVFDDDYLLEIDPVRLEQYFGYFGKLGQSLIAVTRADISAVGELYWARDEDEHRAFVNSSFGRSVYSQLGIDPQL